ncbi:unnamed protein product [marine sediment metagenome]|uniref:Uncharacterized protein n=1 Tax=marine sediment metagenome TaxID=412755 RepID=X0TZ44_9ZZZZ
MPRHANYHAEVGCREWNREDHDPIGLPPLLKWLATNYRGVTRLVVEYDPMAVYEVEGTLTTTEGDGSAPSMTVVDMDKTP